MPEIQDISTLLDAETHALAAVWEREAYLVYNLALRICCEDGPAREAAQRAVLEAVGRDRDDPAVVAPTLRIAVMQAADEPSPATTGDESADRLLAVMARLRPPERAALAVQALCGADATGIGPLMDLTPEAGEALVGRAVARAAERLAIEKAEVARTLEAWPWTTPPHALWESIHAEHYRVAEARLRGRAPATETAAAVTAAAEPRRGPIARGARWLSATLAVAAIGIAATQLAAGAGAGGSPNPPGAGQGDAVAAAPGVIPALDDRAAPAPPADPGGEQPDEAAAVKRAKPLTAAELDRLRMAELRDLERYAKRQSDRRLEPQERQDAAREIERFRRLALDRIAAGEKREAELRRQLAIERMRARVRERQQRKAAARPPAAPAREEQPEDPPASPRPQPSSPAPEEPAGEEAGCLYNESDGTYLCPEGNG